MRVDVPGGDAVRVSGDRQITVSRRVDPLGRVLRVVVDGLVAGPCRVVHAQDGSEHPPARRVVVCDLRSPHVVGSCSGTRVVVSKVVTKKKIIIIFIVITRRGRKRQKRRRGPGNVSREVCPYRSTRREPSATLTTFRGQSIGNGHKTSLIAKPCVPEYI